MTVAVVGAGGPLGRCLLAALGAGVLAVCDPDLPVPAGRVVVGDRVQPERWGPALRGVETLVLLLDRCGPDPGVLQRDLKGAQAVLHAFTAWGTPRRLVLCASALLDDPEPVDPDAPAARYGSTWLAVRASVEARVLQLARALAPEGFEAVVLRAGHLVDLPGAESPLDAHLAAWRAGTEGSFPAWPFVSHRALLADLVDAVGGREVPGQERFLPGFSRATCVQAVASPAGSPAVARPQLLRQGPRYLRRSPVIAPPSAYVAARGGLGSQQLAGLFVGAAEGPA